MPVSALILTLNEERNLPTCLASLEWCDRVVVLDSFSTDRTENIARENGAHLYQRKFDNYAAQRNFGLTEIKYKTPWVLMVDADEIVPMDLAEEIKTTINSGNEDICLYRMRRKDFFMGKWIRRSSGYPTWFGRLTRVGRVSVHRSINEEYHTDGGVGYLQEHLHHYPFNKGLHAWVQRHNKYSSMEAELIKENRHSSINWGNLFSKDPALKRKNLKSLVYRLPGRPFIMFLALYFVRGGFLDGRAGLTFCLLRSFYEFMIDRKATENLRREKGLPL